MSKETDAELWVSGTGLIGKRVAEIARSKEIKVSVTAKSEKEAPTGEIELVDITDFEAVKKYFWDHPKLTTAIIASGLAFPAAAEKNPELAFLVNAEGPRNIGRAILTLPEARRPSVVFMGTALQYNVQDEGPVPENTPFITDGGVYAMSKIKMVDFVRELVAQGLDAKIAMIFNSEGPGHGLQEEKQNPEAGPIYFVPSMADQAAKIRLGLQEPVIRSRYVGHARDFSHVDDTAMGILLALRGKSGNLINISSGYGVVLKDFIDTLIDMSGVKEIRHEVDPKFNTPPKIHASWGDNSRLRSLGFIQKKDMVDICRDIFEERMRLNQK